MYVQFLNTLQDPSERPSAYRKWLQLTLNSVVKRGGILPTEMEKHLIKHLLWMLMIKKLIPHIFQRFYSC